MALKKKQKRPLKKVSTLLFADNVEALKAEAASQFVASWQVLLRRLVDEGLKSKGKKVIVQ